MKKILSSMIILCMFVVLLPAVYVNATGNTYVVQDDFSDLSKWNFGSLNADLTADNVSDTIATTLSSGNKALKITCKSGVGLGNKGVLAVTGASSVTSGKLVYQFDYYLPNDNSAAFTQFGVGGSVIFYGNYKNYITGGGATAPDNSLVKGRWNSIFVIADLDNNTLRVDVNGVNKLLSQAFTAATIYPRLDFTYAEANDIVYFDNVKIYVPGNDFSFVESKISGKTISINPIVDLKFNESSTSVDTSTLSGIVSGANVTAQPVISNIYSVAGGYSLKFASDLEAGKLYTVDLTNVKDFAGNSISNAVKAFTFTTDAFGKKTIRNEDFEGYTVGNISSGNVYNTATMPAKNIGGVGYPLYVSYTTTASPTYSGAINPTSSTASDVSVNVVATTDNGSNPTQALQVLNSTGANVNNLIQYTSNATEVKTTDKKFVYTARIRNGGSAGATGEVGYTAKSASENAMPKAVFGYAILNFQQASIALVGDSKVGDAALNNECQYYTNSLPANGTWFDFRYEVDMTNSNVSVYIDDVLVGSRYYAGKYSSATSILETAYSRWSFNYCYTSGKENAMYLDNMNVSIQDVEPKFNIITPLFTNNNIVVRGIKGGIFNANIDLVNNTAQPVNGKVIAVVKDSEGVLRSVTLSNDFTIATRTNQPVSLSIEMPVDYISCTLELFTFDNLNILKPIYSKYMINSSGGDFVK